jgi:hypothetical protein
VGCLALVLPADVGAGMVLVDLIEVSRR